MLLRPGLRLLDLRLTVGAEMPSAAWAGQLWPPLFSPGMVNPESYLTEFLFKENVRLQFPKFIKIQKVFVRYYKFASIRTSYILYLSAQLTSQSFFM